MALTAPVPSTRFAVGRLADVPGHVPETEWFECVNASWEEAAHPDDLRARVRIRPSATFAQVNGGREQVQR